jgi:hypothetical protein
MERPTALAVFGERAAGRLRILSAVQIEAAEGSLVGGFLRSENGAATRSTGHEKSIEYQPGLRL